MVAVTVIAHIPIRYCSGAMWLAAKTSMLACMLTPEFSLFLCLYGSYNVYVPYALKWLNWCCTPGND